MKTTAIILVAMALIACQDAPQAELVNPAPAPAPASASSNAALPEADPALVTSIPTDALYRFFCGHIKNSMNHPTIRFERAQKELVLCGRGALGGDMSPRLERFDVKKLEDALTAYEALIIHAGYEPQGAPKKVPRTGYVAVSMGDLLPSDAGARAVFNDQQYAVVRNTTPTQAFAYLSGGDGGKQDRPTLYAHTKSLTLMAPGKNETFPMISSKKAFVAFRKLVAAAGK